MIKVLKHDQLLDVTKQFTSIDEHRFLNACLVGKYQKHEFFKHIFYKVDLDHYAASARITKGNAYTEVTGFIEKYQKEPFKVDLGNGCKMTISVIVAAKFDEEVQEIEIQFHPDIIPYISGDMYPGTFCYYDARLDSTSSSKRYIFGEFLQRKLFDIRKKKEIKVTLREIRELLMLDENKYKNVSDLIKKVINPALEDIKKLIGVGLEVEPKRIGKKIGYFIVREIEDVEV